MTLKKKKSAQCRTADYKYKIQPSILWSHTYFHMTSFFIWHKSHICNPRASAIFLQFFLGLKWEERKGNGTEIWQIKWSL